MRPMTGPLALYQASASAMQMTVFFGFILFFAGGAVICRDLLPDQSGSGSGRRISGAGRNRNCRRDTPFFSFFSDPVGNSWNAQCRRRQPGGSKDQDSARQARQMTEQMKSSVNVWLLLQAVVLSLLAFVLVRP